MTQTMVSLRLLAALSMAFIVAGAAAFATIAAPAQPESPMVMSAQDDDDDDDDDDRAGNATGGAPTDAGRPAHIHTGACDDLDPNPAFPLNNVVPRGSDDNSVEESETEVQVALDELLAQPYAINVHASQEDADTYVACGEVTGQVIDDDLIIGLRPQNNSGLAGIAILDDDDDDDETEVTVYLTSIDAGPGAATGETTSGDADTGGDDIGGDNDSEG